MRVLGLMSGTSYDAIDVAIADFSIVEKTIEMAPLHAAQYPIEPRLRRQIASAIKGDPVTAFDICRLDTEIGQAFAEVAVQAIDESGNDVELICSHGQTLYHWEQSGRSLGSLQLGNPAWIAERTGVSVVSDVRIRDIAAGGNGAPLVSTFDVMLAKHHFREPTGFLNLGGIANMTVVPVNGDPIAYDLGPANSLIDAAVEHFTDGVASIDSNGAFAAAGSEHSGLLDRLNSHHYYTLPQPKSTGKETFGAVYLHSLLSEFSAVNRNDFLASLTLHVAQLVSAEASRQGITQVVASGGGLHNAHLAGLLKHHLGNIKMTSIDELGMPSDTKEAYAFGLLGYLTFMGLDGSIATCTGAEQPRILGSITPGRSFGNVNQAELDVKPDRLRICL